MNLKSPDFIELRKRYLGKSSGPNHPIESIYFGQGFWPRKYQILSSKVTPALPVLEGKLKFERPIEKGPRALEATYEADGLSGKFIFLSFPTDDEGTNPYGLNLSEQDLVREMALELGLSEGQYEMWSLENCSRQKFFERAEKISPQLMLPLGALAFNFVMDKKNRLSHSHGKPVEVEENGKNFRITPLFHPSFIQINPNMKKTTWIDLKNIKSTL